MSEVNVLRERKNLFCVISKETFGEYAVRDIQTSSAWNENPYGEKYAIVPDEMVEDILTTSGFCDIVLNDDGTEVVEFTAREIPVIPDPEEPDEPAGEMVTWDAMAQAINEGVNDV